MMARLRQLGGIFSLASKEDGRLMYEKKEFKCKDAPLVDIVMMNDAMVDGFRGRITKHRKRFLRNRLLEDACTIERCKSMMDFLIITRDEFTGIDMERKKAVFGREFYTWIVRLWLMCAFDVVCWVKHSTITFR